MVSVRSFGNRNEEVSDSGKEFHRVGGLRLHHGYEGAEVGEGFRVDGRYVFGKEEPNRFVVAYATSSCVTVRIVFRLFVEPQFLQLFFGGGEFIHWFDW